MFDLERRLYLDFFLSSAWLATALTSIVACMIWEAAKVSTHVASQMRFRPVFQGVTVTPSGLLSERLGDSRIEGIPTEARPLLRMSLIVDWRG